MADIRVRSTDGNNADDGSSWALGKADLHTATSGGLAAAGAGGTCYVSQAHAQTQAGLVTLASPGTYDNPTKVLCGDDAADPPTSDATTATVTNTSTGGMKFTGSAYYRGITFQLTGAVTTQFTLNDETSKSRSRYESCAMKAPSGSGNFVIGAGSNNSRTSQEFTNYTLQMPNSTSSTMQIFNAVVRWQGGSLLTNTNLPTILFTPQSGYGCDAEITGVDLSVLGSGKSLVSGATEPVAARFVFNSCKLGASVSLVSAAPASKNMRVSAYNCDSGDTNYRLWIEDHVGSIRDETTLIRTGGASDGTTGISWKMVTNANANELVAPLISDPIYIWNDTTGSSKTFTVHILHDSATNLTDAEVWPEVSALTTSGFPLGAIVSGQRATPLTTAADQAASTETWATTGMTNPNKQKLAVTFTPQEKGWFVLRICLGKASKTIYACPKGEVS